MKNFLFDSLFLVNLVFSFKILCVLEIYNVRVFIVNGGLEQLPNDVGFILNLSFNAKKFVFHSF